jgi:hypothetical protein
VNQRDALRATQHASDNGTGAAGRWDLLFDAKGQLILPEPAGRDDIAGHCAWLTSVFNLDPAHPITSGQRQGVLGPEGHIELRRAGAISIRFEPATKINTPAKLIETLSWRLTNTDGAVHALKAEHCRQIAHVVRMLCGTTQATTDRQEAEQIVGTFLQNNAEAVNGYTTYGTPGQRYEAAVNLRQLAAPRYLIDTNTGELVIGVSDLQEAARKHVGSSLPRGWLDGRMEAAGWTRITLEGHEQAGRTGRRGPHARCNAYRGHLEPTEPDHNGVTT